MQLKEGVKMNKCIGTRVTFYQYDGGEGSHDKYELLGFCKESVEEVYNVFKDKFLIHQCVIANTNDLDWSYGLIIAEYTPMNIYGLENKITGTLKGMINIINKFSKKHKSLIKMNNIHK
jgi:hypothetical protein